jgi:hypothetical protein
MYPKRIDSGTLEPDHIIAVVDERASGTVWVGLSGDPETQRDVARLRRDDDGGPDWTVWDYGPVPPLLR